MWNALLALSLLGTGPAGREAVRADSQRVVLELHPQRDRYRGAAELFLTIAEPVRHLAIDMDGIEPARIEMHDRAGRVGLRWGERPAGTLLLELERDPMPGPAEIRIAYDRAFADSGLGLVRVGRGRLASVGSNFVAAGARAAFPCLPAPQRWSLTIEVPAAWRVTTNLRRVREARAPGYRTSLWRSARELPADSLRVHITPR